VVFLAANRGNTQVFSIKEETDAEAKKILTHVYNALEQKGYTGIVQIMGYLLTEDPTYITTFNNARSEIRKIDRYDVLMLMIRQYLNVK